jgi:hypothetical protein
MRSLWSISEELIPLEGPRTSDSALTRLWKGSEGLVSVILDLEIVVEGGIVVCGLVVFMVIVREAKQIYQMILELLHFSFVFID